MPQRDTLAMIRFIPMLHNVLHLAGMLLTLLVDNDSQLEFSAFRDCYREAREEKRRAYLDSNTLHLLRHHEREAPPYTRRAGMVWPPGSLAARVAQSLQLIEMHITAYPLSLVGSRC
jgi:hypothetical protein